MLFLSLWRVNSATTFASAMLFARSRVSKRSGEPDIGRVATG
jgi:hypothetical protein